MYYVHSRHIVLDADSRPAMTWVTHVVPLFVKLPGILSFGVRQLCLNSNRSLFRSV